jgi:DUF1680 family protein
MWDFDHEKGTKIAAIRVHMFGSAILSFGVGGEERVGLTQLSNWPWEGEIKFTLTAPSDLSTTIDVRIPGWAKGWEVR